MKNEFFTINRFTRWTGMQNHEITGWEIGEPITSGRKNLLEKILNRDNLNSAYKHVKANKGCPGIDGMTVRAAFYWLKKNKTKLLELIINNTYLSRPLLRKDIKKSGGGVRKLSIPTVVDRIIQQAITQQLSYIFEPLFSESSYGYRPMRSGKMAIQEIKALAEKGYVYASVIDIENYFDSIDHNILFSKLCEKIYDERVLNLIHKFLHCGVIEDGMLRPTVKGCPQGSPLSPILANIYLTAFDYEVERQNRGCNKMKFLHRHFVQPFSIAQQCGVTDYH